MLCVDAAPDTTKIISSLGNKHLIVLPLTIVASLGHKLARRVCPRLKKQRPANGFLHGQASKAVRCGILNINGKP
jgi:hypothetical protein